MHHRPPWRARDPCARTPHRRGISDRTVTTMAEKQRWSSASSGNSRNHHELPCICVASTSLIKELTGFAHRRCRQGKRIKERDVYEHKRCAPRARVTFCQHARPMSWFKQLIKPQEKTCENPAKTSVFQALRSQNIINNTHSFCFTESLHKTLQNHAVFAVFCT